MGGRRQLVARCTLRLSALLAVLASAGCGSQSVRHVVLDIHAASSLADSPVQLNIRGLAEGERVVLRARWTAFGGAVWGSDIPLRADGRGLISLRGISGMRFLWGMRPLQPASAGCCFAAAGSGANAVSLSVTADGRALARATLTRRITPAALHVRRLTVPRDGVFGFLLTPRSATRRPAVLLFGGSEGGDSMVDAAGLLSAHGYATLALAYFKDPGLPSRLENIPLEYFARAIRLLSRQADVDPARIVTMGASRGGEASLLLAATFPRLVHGAIALVPNVNISSSPDSFTIPAWTYRGRPLTPGPIALGRIVGPILAVGAGLDNVWDSPTYVQEIEQRRVGARFHDTWVVYPHAGHNVGGAVPYLPQPTDLTLTGGTAAANAAAKADLWPRILRYLSQLSAPTSPDGR